MQSFTAFEYLCIDIANAFGLDKKVFQERIQWVQTNIDKLETFIDEATDPALYIKAVLAMRQVQAGKPTGHLISLDAVCSGLQIMSALAGCMKGCAATGLVHADIRSDAYAAVTERMNELLAEDQIAEFTVSRSDAKDAVMTAAYGSEATPKNIFGDMVDYFYLAAQDVAPAAFELMPVLVNTWNKRALSHGWFMPDGFVVYIPTIAKDSTRIRVDELGGASVNFIYEENTAVSYSKANCANVIHSVDALVLRNMIRRCSYDLSKVECAIALLEAHVITLGLDKTSKPVSLGEMYKYVHHYEQTNWVDPIVVDFINEENVTQLSLEYATKLLRLLNMMLEHKPFDLITVHDAFRCLAGNGNAVRYWYKEIMAELSESNIIQNILTQLTGRKYKFVKYDEGVAEAIRNSNYGLC